MVLQPWVLEAPVLGGMWVRMGAHGCTGVACTGCASPSCAQDSQYVVAVRNYSPEDGRKLSFHKGDIIHLQPLECPERGERPPTAPPCQNALNSGHGGGRTDGFTAPGGGHALASHLVTPCVPMMSLQTTTMAAWSARR